MMSTDFATYANRLMCSVAIAKRPLSDGADFFRNNVDDRNMTARYEEFERDYDFAALAMWKYGSVREIPLELPQELTETTTVELDSLDYDEFCKLMRMVPIPACFTSLDTVRTSHKYCSNVYQNAMRFASYCSGGAIRHH